LHIFRVCLDPPNGPPPPPGSAVECRLGRVAEHIVCLVQGGVQIFARNCTATNAANTTLTTTASVALSYVLVKKKGFLIRRLGKPLYTFFYRRIVQGLFLPKTTAVRVTTAAAKATAGQQQLS
jgi:hypothetical protein